MADKLFTVAILGCGGRGAESYGRLIDAQKNKYKIVALCDIDTAKLDKYGKVFGVDKKNCFSSESAFFEARRADLIVIATLDADHVRHCIESLKLGYDILIEKPLTDSREECEQLLDAHKRYGGKILVCHVLRYATAFLRTAELIDANTIGELVAINATEQVAYWHQAHSYVRGNWRRSEDTAPMILAKSCHDLDLLQFYAKSRCKCLSSVGELAYFKAENAPADAAKRCTQCKYVDTCPYSAKRIYIDGWIEAGKPENIWPYNVLTIEIPVTEQALQTAIDEGPYGRCVFACDNDVVDHQLTEIVFENGVKATLTMTAFTANLGRIMHFHGTEGEIVLDEEADKICIKPFGKPETTLRINALADSGYGHGGGDNGLVNTMYRVLCGEADSRTSLEASVESHLMGICAEQSRLNGGELVYVHRQ